VSAVEICILDARTFPDAMAGMRQWLDHRRYAPTIFRTTFEGAGLLIRIEFANAVEANEFAQAFGGTM
jgi:hypothetical protein